MIFSWHTTFDGFYLISFVIVKKRNRKMTSVYR